MLFITIKNFKKIFGGSLLVILLLILTINIVNSFYNKLILTSSRNLFPNRTIIIDAGHGEPDGGAVSKDGIKEASLNLQIALKLEETLKKRGFRVIMTRKDEKNIASPDKQKTIREMKVSDIQNRIDIVNSSYADMLISIHMNNFSASKYRGWQTFYKTNSEESKLIAESIQSEMKNSIGLENNRTALKIENIKLIDKSKIPAIIVECGFLSNDEEKNLLQNEEYQKKIVEGIANGIEHWR